MDNKLGILGWAKKTRKRSIQKREQHRKEESLLEGVRKEAEWKSKLARAKREGRRAGSRPRQSRVQRLQKVGDQIKNFEDIIGGAGLGLGPGLGAKKPQKREPSRIKGTTIIVDGKRITISSVEKKKRKKKEQKRRDPFTLI